MPTACVVVVVEAASSRICLLVVWRTDEGNFYNNKNIVRRDVSKKCMKTILLYKKAFQSKANRPLTLVNKFEYFSSGGREVATWTSWIDPQ